ncbi:hypothetical protein NUBL21990_09660 [Klebsiella pneumoniae]|nr:hypothetical protein NUBL21990_09660 [Klebsiella pneumoniae]GKN85896.1 hypothetical protein MS5797_05340 [Klebsiella pneumoniae]
MTTLYCINVSKPQLSEAQANTTRVSTERDRLNKGYQLYPMVSTRRWRSTPTISLTSR